MAEDPQLAAPYAEWAVATNFAYLDGDWFQVLLELDGSAALFARAIEGAELDRLVRIPSIYQEPSRELKPDEITFCMGLMSRDALRILLTGDGPKEFIAKLTPFKKFLKRIELGTPTANIFDRSPLKIDEQLAAAPPHAAIVAVIDDGLAFAHERFRFANGMSRFKYFWNQDDLATTNQPLGFGWGRELTQSQIDSLLASCTSSGIVDEDAVYRAAGQKLVARRAKHGTHVMDVACGLDPKHATAESPYLIGVQLPKWVTEETSGGLLTPQVYAAISYILSRADLIAQQEKTAPLQVVVNLSYGTIAGPHDGTGVFEAAIDQLIAARSTPLRIVLPAGNHYLARCHAHFEIAEANTPENYSKRLHWRVQPDDKASSFMEIWLPESIASNMRPKVAVRITTPNGQHSHWIQPGGDWRWPSLNDVRFEARYYDVIGQRPWIRLAMAPTAGLSASPAMAPSGTWLIEVENEGGAVGIDAWVQRGDTPFGYPLWGRQSRFDDRKYKRFDLAGRPRQEDNHSSYIRRRRTINALATGEQSIVIGGFRRDDGAACEYSGAGPAVTRNGPDAVAIADDSEVLHGILAAGTRTGSVVALSGTSVAAPQITRRIAQWMIANLRSDRAAVQDFAAAGDPGAPAQGSPWEERLGRGRIRGPEPMPFRWKRW
jgi:hypothetical protein